MILVLGKSALSVPDTRFSRVSGSTRLFIVVFLELLYTRIFFFASLNNCCPVYHCKAALKQSALYNLNSGNVGTFFFLTKMKTKIRDARYLSDR